MTVLGVMLLVQMPFLKPNISKPWLSPIRVRVPFGFWNRSRLFTRVCSFEAGASIHQRKKSDFCQKPPAMGPRSKTSCTSSASAHNQKYQNTLCPYFMNLKTYDSSKRDSSQLCEVAAKTHEPWHVRQVRKSNGMNPGTAPQLGTPSPPPHNTYRVQGRFIYVVRGPPKSPVPTCFPQQGSCKQDTLQMLTSYQARNTSPPVSTSQFAFGLNRLLLQTPDKEPGWLWRTSHKLTVASSDSTRPARDHFLAPLTERPGALKPSTLTKGSASPWHISTRGLNWLRTCLEPV